MVLDGHGNLYVAENAAVRKITPAGYVSTLAGEAPGALGAAQWQHNDA
jgi:hypothetical protein